MASPPHPPLFGSSDFAQTRGAAQKRQQILAMASDEQKRQQILEDQAAAEERFRVTGEIGLTTKEMARQSSIGSDWDDEPDAPKQKLRRTSHGSECMQCLVIDKFPVCICCARTRQVVANQSSQPHDAEDDLLVLWVSKPSQALPEPLAIEVDNNHGSNHDLDSCASTDAEVDSDDTFVHGMEPTLQIDDLRSFVELARAASRYCGDITWLNFDWSFALSDAAVAEYAVSVVNNVDKFYVGVSQYPLYRHKGLQALGAVPFCESAKRMKPHCKSYSNMAVLAVRKPRGSFSAGRLERQVIAHLGSIDYLEAKMCNRSNGGEHISSRAEGYFLYIVYS